MTSDTSNLNLSYHDKITHQTPINQPLIETHLLQVRQSGSVIVYGVLATTHNTDYHVILHFEGEIMMMSVQKLKHVQYQ